MKRTYQEFIRSIHRLRNKTDAIYSIPGTHQDWRFHYASVNLVSEVWQLWCRFCRQILIVSCNGTKLRNGRFVFPRSGDNSWQRIAYEVIEYGHGRKPKLGKKLRFQWQEPTWGDVRLLLQAMPYLQLSNFTELSTAFGVSLQAPKHLQIVRNTCFHINNETISEVKRIQPFYIGSLNGHPINIIWCLDPLSRSDAIYVWYNELEIIAELAT